MEPIRIIQSIQNKIYEIRGRRVMLESDVAALYGIEPKQLSETVKRNIQRFPEGCLFQLTPLECAIVRSQSVAASGVENSLRPQDRDLKIIGKSSFARRPLFPRYAFTTKGLKMLLKVFPIGEHDAQLSGIYDAIENLLDVKAAQRRWEDRERIGFKK